MSVAKESPDEFLLAGGKESHSPPNYRPLRLKQLAEECWKVKIIGICLVLLSVAGGATVGFMRPPMYKATVVMAPASETATSIGSGAVSSLMSQVQGLASLAGLGGAGGEKKFESVAVLQSESLTDSFISKYKLLPILFASQWDKQRQTWRIRPGGSPPDLWRGYVFFNKSVRKVATDTRTGLITLTITWRDPHVAAAWANDLVSMANAYLRQKAIAESDRNIAYLNQQAEHTSLVEEQQAISAVLESEITTSMLARGNDEYAFKVLDPAFVSGSPSSLGAKDWAAGGLVVGLLLWFVIVLLRLAWNAP